MKPSFIGAKAEIEIYFEKPKLLAFLKFLMKDCGTKGSNYAFKGTDLGVALLLIHFSNFKNSSVGSLQKDVNKYRRLAYR